MLHRCYRIPCSLLLCIFTSVATASGDDHHWQPMFVERSLIVLQTRIDSRTPQENGKLNSLNSRQQSGDAGARASQKGYIANIPRTEDAASQDLARQQNRNESRSYRLHF